MCGTLKQPQSLSVDHMGEVVNCPFLVEIGNKALVFNTHECVSATGNALLYSKRPCSVFVLSVKVSKFLSAEAERDTITLVVKNDKVQAQKTCQSSVISDQPHWTRGSNIGTEVSAPHNSFEPNTAGYKS